MQTTTLVLTAMLLTFTSAAAHVAVVAEDGPQEILACVGYALQQMFSGNPIEPCAVGASGATAPCSVKDAVGCAMWTVKCAGDALGGHACHGDAATAGPDVDEVVSCTKQAVRNILQGTPQPCPIG